MPKTILNIAAGKFQPIGISLSEPRFLVNLDTMYYQCDDPAVIEHEHAEWMRAQLSRSFKTFHCNEDAFSFMARTKIWFDKICIYRFLEHVSFTQVQYFIYLLSTILKPGGWIDIVVPDYEILAQMILLLD